MDFPQPDSPTSPIVSPGRTQKDTLSTMSTSPWACDGQILDLQDWLPVSEICGKDEPVGADGLAVAQLGEPFIQLVLGTALK